MLKLTQQQLADASGVNIDTIRRFETDAQVPYPATLDKIREAFERRGIEFLNGGSPGIRMRPETKIID